MGKPRVFVIGCGMTKVNEQKVNFKEIDNFNYLESVFNVSLYIDCIKY